MAPLRVINGSGAGLKDDDFKTACRDALEKVLATARVNALLIVWGTPEEPAQWVSVPSSEPLERGFVLALAEEILPDLLPK